MTTDIAVVTRSYMLTKTAITDLVGQRIYTDVLPQGATMPAVALFIDSEDYEHALDGLTGLVASRLRVECYAATRLVANAIAEAITWCGIDQQKGRLSYTVSGTTYGANIRSVMVETGKRYFTEPDNKGGDSERYVTTFDFMVTFLKEA